MALSKSWIDTVPSMARTVDNYLGSSFVCSNQDLQLCSTLGCELTSLGISSYYSLIKGHAYSSEFGNGSWNTNYEYGYSLHMPHPVAPVISHGKKFQGLKLQPQGQSPVIDITFRPSFGVVSIASTRKPTYKSQHIYYDHMQEDKNH